MTTESDNMDAAALDARLAELGDAWTDGGDEPASDTATEQQAEQADEQTAEKVGEPEAGEQGEGEKPAAEQPQNPPKQVPVTELVEMRRRAQAAEAALAEAKAQQAQWEAQQQQAKDRAQYDAIEAEYGVEAAQQWYAQTTDSRQALAVERARMDQQVAHERAVASEQFAREAYPDYQQQFDKLAGLIGADALYRQAVQQPNPGKWVYEQGKAIVGATDLDSIVKQRVEEGVKAALADLQSKHQPPPKGGTSIGHLNANPSGTPHKAYEDMTDAELAELDREMTRKAFG